MDWFRIVITTNSLLTVTLNVPAGLDYDLEVYGPDTLWRAGSYEAAGQDEIITTPVSPGTYYLRVYGYPAGSGDFSQSQPYQLSTSTLVIPTSGTVSGTLTNSVTWGGTVDLTGDVTVAPGATLTILPGTLVRCHAGGDSRSSGTDASRVEIILNGGTLNAVGTSGSPIVFTSDAVNKSSGDWYGIRLVAGSVSLSHFLIEFAVNGLRLEDSDTRFDSYLIEHGAIRNSSSYALYQMGSQGTVELNDLTVTNNSNGIQTSGLLLMRDSRINRNTRTGINGSSYSLTLTNCDVSTNGGPGIQVDSKAVVVQNCTIQANQSYGLYDSYGSVEVRNSQIQRNYGTGVYLSRPSPVTLVGNTISKNTSQGLLLNFNSYGSESAEGITNNVIRNNDVGVQVYGNALSVLNLSGNDIYQNLTFELRNDSGMPVTATNCYWGEPTSTELNANQVNLSRIYDQRDNGSYGLVTVLNPRSSPFSGGGSGGGTALTITSHPQPQTVVAGTPASFTVAASGTSPFGYQWRKNSNPISGATNVTLLLLSVQAGDAGTYSVIVSNSAGTATSSGALLTVNPAPSNLATRTITRTGAVFSVSMTVSPWAGLGFGFVEETIPTGFTATGLNAGGTFNASTGKILWGPMADSQTYQLNYTLQPPVGFQGSRQLTGTAYFFGSGTLVTGDSMVSIIPAGTPATLALTKMFGFWTVSITGDIGRSYRLEASDDLNSGQWQPLATLNITQNPHLYIDGDAVGKSQRFYRAILVE